MEDHDATADDMISQLSLLAVIHDVESLKQSKAQTPASTAVKSGFSVGT